MTITTETLLLIVTLFLALSLGGCCGLAWYNLRRWRSRRLAILMAGELITIGLLALSEPEAAAKTLAFLVCFNLPVLFALTEADTRTSEEREQMIDRALQQSLRNPENYE